MAEVGAKPKVSSVRRKVMRAMSTFFTPLMPDDYLDMINPLWSTEELRGKVEKLERRTEDAVTIIIKPGADWDRHKPGQYLRVGVIVDGVHHWRAYSLTSEPSDDFISITPKLVPEGKVSPHLTTKLEPGHDRPPRRRGGRLHAARRAAGEGAVHLRRERDHSDHEHAAGPRSGGWRQGRGARPLGPHQGRRDLPRLPRGPRQSLRGLPDAPPADRGDGPHRAQGPRGDLPRLARARSLPLRAHRDARHDGGVLGEARATSTCSTPSASSPSRGWDPSKRARAARSSS